MKLTAIILLIACMQVSARTGAQTVTLSLKNASLEKVFNQIKKQTGYSFVYNNSLLAKAKKVTIDVRNGSLEEVLEACFKEQSLTYEIIDRTIVVKPKEVISPKDEEVASLRSQVAPPVDVKGRIVNENGEPVIATVMVKGTKIGTTTNANGEFQLSGIDENAVLVISGVSIETQEIAVAKNPGLKSGEGLTISAKTEITTLNEVVINKGYYTEKQRFSVSNVGKVTAMDIEKQPVNNPLLALQGRVPGLLITQQNGISGGAISVRIQGKNSLNSGNVPLYIVDGVPYYSQLPLAGSEGILGNIVDDNAQSSVTYGNALAFLNSSDIESIEVLKDADATAIYGSRAANGAILITTKQGRAGKMKVDARFEKGWSKVARFMKVLDRRQYLDMRYEAYKNDGIDFTTQAIGSSNLDLRLWDTTRSTNWQDLLIGGTGTFTNANLSISGGSSNNFYLLSGTYNRTTTIFPGDFSDTKASFHFSLNSNSPNQKFKSQFSSSFLFDDNRLPGIDLTGMANRLEPIAPSLFNSDGTPNWALNAAGSSTWTNPIIPVYYQKFSAKTRNWITALNAGYIILKGLELKSNFGFTFLDANNFQGTPLEAIRPQDRSVITRSARYGDRQVTSWIIEPQLHFKTSLGKARIESLLGTSAQQNRAEARTLEGKGYPNDQVLEDLKAALTLGSLGSSINEYKYNALFTRIGYTYDNKYLLSLNGRRDGSSRYGANNRFQNFGAFGIGWIFSNESFFQKHLEFLSFGKIKASYGVTGSDQIGDYTFLSLYEYNSFDIPYQNSSSLLAGQISNPYLQWEVTKKLQIGLDLGLINDRVLLNTSWSRNRSSNQIISYNLPSNVGRTSVIKNFPAIMENTSLEISLNTTNIKNSNFVWTSSINVTMPRNKIASFPDLENSSFKSALIVGQPFNITPVYNFLGVNPANGEYVFLSGNGNPTARPIAATDQTLRINLLPAFYGGFENKFTYRDLEFHMFFDFIKKKALNNYYNNGTSIAPGRFLAGSTNNHPATVLDRWVKPGDIATVRKFSTVSSSSGEALGWVQRSTAGFTDASFIRLKNISLSYKLPAAWANKIRIAQARIFVHGQNILTVTKFAGLDPESINPASLPPLRSLVTGFQLIF